MNREILFRGFHKDENGTEIIYINDCPIKGKWVYGYYFEQNVYENINDSLQDVRKSFILEFTHEDYDYDHRFEVIPETVGKYANFDDDNKKKIFENDVIKYDSGLGGYEFSIVYYDEHQLSLNIRNSYIYNGIHNLRTKKNIEVVGTIFDKKEVKKMYYFTKKEQKAEERIIKSMAVERKSNFFDYYEEEKDKEVKN